MAGSAYPKEHDMNGTLSMFTNDDEWIIGSDLADAMASVQMAADLNLNTPDSWRPLDPKSTVTFLLDYKGNLSDRGKVVEMTVAEAIQKFGRGFYASTEF